MPYIAFDLDALAHLPNAARAADVDEADIALGLVRMWEWCWRTKTDVVSSTQLRGFFGNPSVGEALVAFGFLEAVGDGFRARGADRYLRVRASRSAGGHAAKGNLKRGVRQEAPPPTAPAQPPPEAPAAPAQSLSSPAAAGDEPGKLSESPRLLQRAASSEQRTASSKTTPLPPVAGGLASDASGTESIRDVIEQVHREVRQSDYQWKGHPGAGDDGLVRDILHLAKSNPDEVRRVWRKALGTNFPLCLDLATLKKHWSVYAGVEPPRATADPRKAAVRAEDIPASAFANPGRVHDF